MCTVTYLPTEQGFTLTHNRDEAPARSPKTIVREKNNAGDTLLFPRDVKSGGSWIATAANGRTACVLNGAFVKHAHRPPYRRSRGLVLLDFFDWQDTGTFFSNYDFEGVEPFTFLYFGQNQLSAGWARQAVEFRWDGSTRHIRNLDISKAYFWSSATLYPPEMQQRREQIFKTWLSHRTKPNPTNQQITQLHLRGSVGDPENNFVMNRAGKVQTVSLTQVIVDEKTARMRYRDLLDGNRSERRVAQRHRAA